MALTAVRRAPSQSVQRWDPFQELQELHEQLNQVVGSALTGAGDGHMWTPLSDIEETEDAWLVETDLPGVNRADINVDVQGSELVVSGEIKEKERVGILRRRTRPVGRFEFRMTLPPDADSDNIDANLSDGVLKVRIPKSDGAQSRRIDVTSG
jgi:HSP20 family protein